MRRAGNHLKKGKRDDGERSDGDTEAANWPRASKGGVCHIWKCWGVEDWIVLLPDLISFAESDICPLHFSAFRCLISLFLRQNYSLSQRKWLSHLLQFTFFSCVAYVVPKRSLVFLLFPKQRLCALQYSKRTKWQTSFKICSSAFVVAISRGTDYTRCKVMILKWNIDFALQNLLPFKASDVLLIHYLSSFSWLCFIKTRECGTRWGHGWCHDRDLCCMLGPQRHRGIWIWYACMLPLLWTWC